MSDLAEYTHETYGTARATIKLPAGRVEVSNIISPGEFATDREITDAEYHQIRRVLQEVYDCAVFSSNPGFLLKSDVELAEAVKRSVSPFKIPRPAP